MRALARHTIVRERVSDPRSSPRVVPDARVRILLYSHDSCGLGNIRRTLLLAEQLREEYPASSILVVTGSPVIHAFRMPPGVDYLKLPTLDRTDADRYAPRFLEGDSIMSMRRAVLERAVVGFAADLVVVDKRPLGIDGELHDALVALTRAPKRPRLVLGIRDILDEPTRARASLERTGAIEAISRFYDEVWIYGEESIFDAVRAYGFPDEVAARTRYCGYLRRPTQLSARRAGPPRVLVTTGGGEDGATVLSAYLADLVALPRGVAMQSVVVLGPDLPAASRLSFRDAFGALPDVELVEFETDMARRYADADVVVSMAGYNTVCELLSTGSKAVLVPRVAPVQEQWIRAKLFAERGYFQMITPDALVPGALMALVREALVSPCPPRDVDLDGLPRVRARVRALLEGRRS